MKNFIISSAFALVTGCTLLGCTSEEETVQISYQELLKKAENESVTPAEVKGGIGNLVLFFCNDEDLQKSGGGSTKSCISNYEQKRDGCDAEILGDLESGTSKSDIIKLTKEYTAYVK